MKIEANVNVVKNNIEHRTPFELRNVFAIFFVALKQILFSIRILLPELTDEREKISIRFDRFQMRLIRNSISH